MNARTPPRRSRMVHRLRQQGIRDEAVLAAMAIVPREKFVPAPFRQAAYDDTRQPIGQGQTMSRPWTVARLAELLELDRDARPKVLEIGAGSGYQAAVLAEMGARVYSVERHAALARTASKTVRELGYLQVTVKHFDGTYGWAAMSPYAGIVVTAGGPEVPRALVDQLQVGGRLVMPKADDAGQRLVVVERRHHGTRETDAGPASFVPLIGRFGYDPSARP